MTKTNVEWALEISPPWMVGPVGELWTSALGFWFDMQAEAAVQAVKAAQLRSDTFHVSALPLIGNERQMPRYPIETDDQYNLRLRGCEWDIANGGANPNDAALATATNWDTVVADNKLLPGAILKTR